jgi:hypothetical protein
VDGDLPTGSWSGLNYEHPTTGGPIWGAIFEKAYAFFCNGGNTYNSIDTGFTGKAFYNLGVATTTFYASSPSVFNTLTTALANHKAVAAETATTITSGTPLIGSHAYTIAATSVDANGTQYLTVRNPWGDDGMGSDVDPPDGLVTLTLAQFQSNFSIGSIQV